MGGGTIVHVAEAAARRPAIEGNGAGAGLRVRPAAERHGDGTPPPQPPGQGPSECSGHPRRRGRRGRRPVRHTTNRHAVAKAVLLAQTVERPHGRQVSPLRRPFLVLLKDPVDEPRRTHAASGQRWMAAPVSRARREGRHLRHRPTIILKTLRPLRTVDPTIHIA